MTNVVITGGSQGIGRGLAREFATRGCKVVISGRSAETLQATLDDLASLDGSVFGRAGNVSEHAQQQALWDFAVEQLGSVDIWINNAGLARTIWPILETPIDQVEAMITTNMRGTVFGSMVAATGMKFQGGGKIFNMLGGGSDGEYFPGIAIYGTTKRGLDYFCTALAKELKDSGVILGRVRPGMIVTEAVVREAAADRDNFERSRKMINNIVDQVETVAPFLVDEMLSFKKNGGKIRWLNGAKIAFRMLKSLFVKRSDQFEKFGL